MMPVFPATYLGDFSEERTVLLAQIPSEADEGQLLRALWLLADPMPSDPTRYWILRIGRFGEGAFIVDAAHALSQGVAATPIRVDFGGREIRVQCGYLIAIRLTPSGPDVPPLSGVSVIPEFSPTSARTR